VPRATIIDGDEQRWSWLIAVLLVLMEGGIILDDILLPIIQSNTRISVFEQTMQFEECRNNTTTTTIQQPIIELSGYYMS
jgi:hypothetical protein